MSIHKTEAIVLNRRDFRETSAIADFYTKDFGKISGLLKGIKTEPSKFASRIEPFSHNELIFYKKRNSSLHLVTQVDSIDNFDLIRQSIPKVTICSFMMELIGALMAQEDNNVEVFDLGLSCLQELKTTNIPDKVMTIFKIKMLALSGFRPHLDSCICCQNKILGQSRFSLSLGGLLCEGCLAKDTNSRSIFRGTVASILHIEKNDVKNNLNLGLNPEIKKELDIILNAFLNFHLEKELKSQRVLNKITVATC